MFDSKDYEVKEYLKKNGNWYYFKVRNFWSGARRYMYKKQGSFLRSLKGK